jgi:mRNA interferase RelE/StbE
VKDLDSIHPVERRRIMAGIDKLQSGLVGDIKRLTHFQPEYRLRVGNYRILFEVGADNVTIYRILHRSNAYQ